jgi:hypothetical protein
MPAERIPLLEFFMEARPFSPKVDANGLFAVELLVLQSGMRQDVVLSFRKIRSTGRNKRYKISKPS